MRFIKISEFELLNTHLIETITLGEMGYSVIRTESGNTYQTNLPFDTIKLLLEERKPENLAHFSEPVKVDSPLTAETRPAW